jgi:hypothetical protein
MPNATTENAAALAALINVGLPFAAIVVAAIVAPSLIARFRAWRRRRRQLRHEYERRRERARAGVRCMLRRCRHLGAVMWSVSCEVH